MVEVRVALLIMTPRDPLEEFVLCIPVTFSNMGLVPSQQGSHLKKDIIILKASPVEVTAKRRGI